MSESDIKPKKNFFNKIHEHVKDTAKKAKAKISSVFHKDDELNKDKNKSIVENQVSIFYGSPRNKAIADIIEISAPTKRKSVPASDISDISDFDSPVKIKENTAVSIPVLSRIFGNISSWFRSNTKDGEINYAKQGNTGDCWLIAAVNALSYTQKGKESVKEALEYQDDGTLVHLKGAGDYFISNKILKTAKGSLQYARDDDDMIILELAIESALDDIANGKIILPENSISEKYYLKTATKAGSSTLDAGNAGALFYLLTGKISECINKSADGKNLSAAFNLFEEHKLDDVAMTVGLYTSNKVVRDIHGKKVTLYEYHSYSVNKVSDGVVTVTDPISPKKKIELDIETATAVFEDFHIMDLSEQNPTQERIIPDRISVENLNNDEKLEQMLDKDGNVLREIKYDKRGKKVSMHSFGNNTETLFEYDSYGQVRRYISNNKSLSGSYRTAERIFSAFGEELTNHETDYTKNGQKKSEEHWEKNNLMWRNEYNNGKISMGTEYTYDSDSKMQTKTITVYDSMHNPVSKTIYDAYGQIIG